MILILYLFSQPSTKTFDYQEELTIFHSKHLTGAKACLGAPAPCLEAVAMPSKRQTRGTPVSLFSDISTSVGYKL